MVDFQDQYISFMRIHSLSILKTLHFFYEDSQIVDSQDQYISFIWIQS